MNKENDLDVIKEIEEIITTDQHFKKGNATVSVADSGLGRTKVIFQTGNNSDKIADATYAPKRKYVMRFPDEEQLKENPGYYVLTGCKPEKPFITRNHNITALGSCFAENITKYISQLGFKANKEKENFGHLHLFRYGAEFYNTFSIRQQFAWALENEKVMDGTWYDESGVKIVPSEQLKFNTQEILLNTDVFIITFGGTQIYRNKNGEVAWRKFSPKNSGFESDDWFFELSNTQQNENNINDIYKIIRKHIPNATIIFTVSPVAMKATFLNNTSSVCANMQSKSTLRSSLGDFFQKNKEDKNLFYWPSYECIWYWLPSIGMRSFETDLRHPENAGVAAIMTLFKKYFLVQE